MSCGKGKYGVEQWWMLSCPDRDYELEMSPLVTEIKLITLASATVLSKQVDYTQCESSSTKYRSKQASCGSRSGNLGVPEVPYG